MKVPLRIMAAYCVARAALRTHVGSIEDGIAVFALLISACALYVFSLKLEEKP